MSSCVDILRGGVRDLEDGEGGDAPSLETRAHGRGHVQSQSHDTASRDRQSTLPLPSSTGTKPRAVRSGGSELSATKVRALVCMVCTHVEAPYDRLGFDWVCAVFG